MRRARSAHRAALLFTIAVAMLVLPAAAALLARPLASPARPIIAVTAAPSAPAPVPELFHSAWFTQSEDPTIAVGDEATVTFVFRNAGLTAWVKGTRAEMRLGETGPHLLPPGMRVDWPYPDRPAIQQEASVGPDQLATFVVTVRGTTPGLFRLDVRPVLDGVKWLEDDGVYATIMVVEE